MISQGDIKQNLKEINELYLNSKTQKEALYFSKLAIIELCGWIEVSMDQMVLDCAKRTLKIQANIDFVKERIIKPTFGFEYDKHFRDMLIQVVGVLNTEKIETNFDETKLHLFKSSLGTLKESRDNLAHKYIDTTTRIDAPSATIKHFKHVADGLESVDTYLCDAGL